MKKTIPNLLKIKSIEELILYRDSDFFIINKPPGISTLADRSSPTNILTLSKILYPEAKVCHRLDKQTSGILLIAKNRDGHRFLSSLFESRDITKMYHAVVPGRHQFDEAQIEKPIYSSSNRSRIDMELGKPSLTLITTLQVFREHTLLACMPFTGRMHQIRVHLADFGIPIVGDHQYGGEDLYLSSLKRNYSRGKDREELPLIRRLALHAAGISFVDQKEKKVKVMAPYPKDFSVLLKQLEKNVS